jgi:hypothetical protein
MNSSQTIILEIMAVFMTWFLAINGVETAAPENQLISSIDYPIFNKYVLIFGRQIFGLSLSYLAYLALNPAITKISYFRPSRVVSMILSWKIWIPIATLSYSIYVFHIPYMF